MLSDTTFRSPSGKTDVMPFRSEQLLIQAVLYVLQCLLMMIAACCFVSVSVYSSIDVVQLQPNGAVPKDANIEPTTLFPEAYPLTKTPTSLPVVINIITQH
jgi:hypothetical protein